MSCQFARWSDVASDSRHDHASGTLMTRPSIRCAVIISSVTSMLAIRGSTLTAVLMPYLGDPLFMIDDQTTNLIQFPRAETMVPESRESSAIATLPDG